MGIFDGWCLRTGTGGRPWNAAELGQSAQSCPGHVVVVSAHTVRGPALLGNWVVPGGVAGGHCILGLAAFFMLNGITTVRLRSWNPSQQLRPQVPDSDEDYSVASPAAEATAGSWKVRPPRPMWNNPVLWREVRTWAYGRKLLLIRLSYLLLFLIAVAALHWSVESGVALQPQSPIRGVAAHNSQGLSSFLCCVLHHD